MMKKTIISMIFLSLIISGCGGSTTSSTSSGGGSGSTDGRKMFFLFHNLNWDVMFLLKISQKSGVLAQ